MLLGASASACNFDAAGCIDTTTTAEPADGAGGGEVFLVARVTADGRPLAGAKVEYTLTEPGTGSDVGAERTNDDGVARYPLTHYVKSGQLREEDAANATHFVATVNGFVRDDTAYCRSEATATVRWR